MYKYIKRLLDIIFSIIGIILCLPIWIIVPIVIKLDSKGSVIFKQERVGKNQKIFIIYKYRTMKADTPQYIPQHLLSNPQDRYTKVGKFLRKTSIDELPQLFNILFGQMSFVGPRPSIITQEKLNEDRAKLNVFSVLPGVTGWAQVNGRGEISEMEKVKYDSEYIQRQSFWFDIKIFFKTFAVVFIKR